MKKFKNLIIWENVKCVAKWGTLKNIMMQENVNL